MSTVRRLAWAVALGVSAAVAIVACLALGCVLAMVLAQLFGPAL